MIRFKKFSIFIILFTLIISSSFNDSHGITKDKKDFKVVGYYSEIFKDTIDENVQFDKLTHITYAFLIPGEDGSLIGIEKPEKLKELVEKSHKNNVEVLIAVGGWSYKNIALDPNFEKMAGSSETRKKFIDNIIKFVDQYDLDGVEIDWEYPDLGESSQNYEKLILELGKRLKEEDKYLTAALNGAWSKTEGPAPSKAVTDNCLKEFDWINIMAYDSNNEQHSPFWFASTSISYWINRGVPKEKIVIGVPFYARPSWKQYRHLVNEDRENAYKDYAKGDPLDSYYNGINTIKEKTRLALKNASGIMIFDINEDTTDDLSLLKAMNDTIDEVSSMSLDEFNKKMYFVINGHELTFRKEENMGIPFIDENNRTLMPIRKPLEMIGAHVSFNKKDCIVTAKKGDTTIEIPIGKDHIKINNEELKMDTKTIIKEGRTYIPLKYVFEGFNYNIKWHEESRTILVEN
ncbi:MAG: glycosyl hydrolase family 18 protein [Anaeromicrobium sp.]|jgi:GH18 family chitinase|uniref:glycosyl hydrolase family 18 protein n=1 Tax=Anaeromicrobium sp. TaxID=1929132 RepID=UPI0025FB455C|nr:glycosyl hydrolase family 18 protein [Anaeromicrobium sp.]MCT4595152.1 glycosyl hydrolase family 18 protein [Anaeromicrobium sp.]